MWLSETHGTSYYLNSEGFKTVTPVGSVYFRVFTEGQAEDGATVRDLFTIVERRLEDLPPMAELVARATELAKRAEDASHRPGRRGIHRAGAR